MAPRKEEADAGARVVPPFWAPFAWLPMVRPRLTVPLVLLGALAIAAGGMAGVFLGAQSSCKAATAAAATQFGFVADRIQEEVSTRTLPVVSLGTFVRQTPYFPDLEASFDSIAADLLEQESAVRNLQLAPGGVVSAIYPVEGHEGAIGHDLFLDLNRRPDSFKAIDGAPGVTLSNPVTLNLEGESGRAVFARYPVFIDGPVANRSEAFGKPDAYDCGDPCYGDPARVYWGMTTALVDFDVLLESTGLTHLEEEAGACFTLRTGGAPNPNATDLVSTNSTIYASECEPANPIVIPVIVPNGEWYLEIGFSGACAPWAAPVAAVLCAAVLALLALVLFSVYQATRNRLLTVLGFEAEVGHLRERQRQLAREEAAVASDSVRHLVTALTRSAHFSAELEPATFRGAGSLMSQSSSSCSFVNKASGQSGLIHLSANLSITGASRAASMTSTVAGTVGFLVMSQVHNLGKLSTADEQACSAMLDALRMVVLDLVARCHGEAVAMEGGSSVVRFRSAAAATEFALQLRQDVLDTAWPPEVLALPGNAPVPTAVTFQPDVKGPRLQILIDEESGPSADYVRQRLCSAVLPRQILMTNGAWVHMVSTLKLAAAGFPDILPLGAVALGEQDGMHVVFEVSPPSWDLRMAQLDAQGPGPAFLQLARPLENLWTMPQVPRAADGSPGDLAVAALELQPRGGAVPSAPVQQKLHAVARSMAVLFGGYNLTPGGAWVGGEPVLLAFVSADCALSFAACFQKALLHTPWAEEELATWGARDVGLLGKLRFAGPRVRCAVDLQPANTAAVATAHDCPAAALLEAAHGGQVLMSEAVASRASAVFKENVVQVLDLGCHRMAAGSQPTRLKELQVRDVPRSFPPPRTLEEVSPGFQGSPDPGQPVTFVFCQAVCQAGTAVSSTQSWSAALESWKALAASMARPLGGYETHARGANLGLAFPSLEAGTAFAVSMQKALLDLALPPTLTQHEAFKPKLGSQGQVVFCGLLVKMGISCGIPAMRQPHRQTGVATYQGVAVQQGARIMLAASPGQVLLEGSAAVSHLGLEPKVFQATMGDARQEATVISTPALADMGVPAVHLRPLGLFKLQLQAGESSKSLVDAVLPELAERAFSMPPGRVGVATAGEGSPHTSLGALPRMRPSARGSASSASLQSMLVDIMGEHAAAKVGGSEEKVAIRGLLGKGMQGTVYLGRWKGVDVAYKVVALPPVMSGQNKKETRALLEVAISATLAHPNLVQTYSYEIVRQQAVEASGPAQRGSVDGLAGLASAPLLAEAILEEAERDTQLLDDGEEGGGGGEAQEARLIQELCDKKTLRHNLDRGKLKAPGEALPDTELMLALALDIACGLAHLHSRNIVHGDLKALNVLLTSCAPRLHCAAASHLPNVTAKVTDFGLSAKLSNEQTHVSNVNSGTMTHMAPEILLAGQLSKAADVYAFGILLFEMFTGERPFEGLSVQQVAHSVGTLGRRPVFPPAVPRGVVELACACWGPADQRPTFDRVMVALEGLIRDRKQHRGLRRSQTNAALLGPPRPAEPTSPYSPQPPRDAGGVVGAGEVDFAALQRAPNGAGGESPLVRRLTTGARVARRPRANRTMPSMTEEGGKGSQGGSPGPPATLPGQ